jgi:hypothetical protein
MPVMDFKRIYAAFSGRGVPRKSVILAFGTLIQAMPVEPAEVVRRIDSMNETEVAAFRDYSCICPCEGRRPKWLSFSRMVMRETPSQRAALA